MQPEAATLLLVEPEAEATQDLIAFLRRHEIEVIWARDGDAALDALEREALHVLVVALQAPRIDGLAVLRRAIERHPAICAIGIASARRGQSGGRWAAGRRVPPGGRGAAGAGSRWGGAEPCCASGGNPRGLRSRCGCCASPRTGLSTAGGG